MSSASIAYLSTMSPRPWRKYVPRLTGSRNPNQRRSQRSSMLRFRFLELLLPRLRHLRGDFGRRVLVDVELHPIGPAPVRNRVERGRVAIQLGLGDERFHLREPSILLRSDDMPAT